MAKYLKPRKSRLIKPKTAQKVEKGIMARGSVPMSQKSGDKEEVTSRISNLVKRDRTERILRNRAEYRFRKSEIKKNFPSNMATDSTLVPKVVKRYKKPTTEQYLEFGNISMERQEYGKAISAYSKVIMARSHGLYPHTSLAQIYTKRGQAYQSLGKWVLANEDFTKAKSIDSRLHQYSQQSKYDGRTRDIDWEILPAGWWHNARRRASITAQFKNPEHARLFFERLEFLESFLPQGLYRSTFNSQTSPYYAFVFAQCVVAENPLEGNALYVVKGLESWQILLGLSKAELQQRYRHRVRRIIHKGDWKGRLREELLVS